MERIRRGEIQKLDRKSGSIESDESEGRNLRSGRIMTRGCFCRQEFKFRQSKSEKNIERNL